MNIIGVDPGAAHTGLVLRAGDHLLWHATAQHWSEVMVQLNRVSVVMSIDVVAIEEVTAPLHIRGQKLLDPKHVITTALVAGTVAGWAWSDSLRVEWIPAAHNGQGDLLAYPEPLRPTRGQGKGADSLRHERSAWDVAGTAAVHARGRVIAHG